MNLSFDWLERFRDFGLLVLRAVIGGTFVFHGWHKLMAGPKLWTKLGDAMSHFGLAGGELYWGMAATFAELLGGIFLVLGVLVRPSALGLFFTMAVASVVKFDALNWGRSESVNEFFYPLTMAAVAFALIFVGGGKIAPGVSGGAGTTRPAAAPKEK